MPDQPLRYSSADPATRMQDRQSRARAYRERAVLLMIAVLTAGCTSAGGEAKPADPTSVVDRGIVMPLEAAHETCGPETDIRTALSLAEGDSRTLTLDIADADNTVTLDCVLHSLATPKKIATQIRTVRPPEEQNVKD